MACANHPTRNNTKNIRSSRKSQPKMARHWMPPNHKTDAAGVKGFTIGWSERPGHQNTIMEDANTGHATHIHKHPNGITLSSFHPDGRVTRFTFNTGRGSEGRWNPKLFGKR